MNDFHKVTATNWPHGNGKKVSRLTIDGREVKGWTDYSISYHSPGLARVRIEFYATVEPETAVIGKVQDG